RAKKGQPAQSTTGVARAIWIQGLIVGGMNRSIPKTCPPISMTSRGNDSTTPNTKRRFMSRSSGLGPSPALGVIGSRAMPQIGQAPGPSRTISGCMGQVHLAPAGAVGGAWTVPDAGSGGLRYWPGFASNLLLQLALQNRNSRP